MGGRGAGSGISNKGHQYGTDYKTILQSGNIKFVMKTSKNSETMMETMTKGRIYAYVNEAGKVSNIVYFDNNNKRSKQIDLQKEHDGVKPHIHHGYLHNENDSKKGYSHLTPKEKKMVERINQLWYNRRK